MERSRRLIAAGTPLVISIRLAIAVLLVSLGSLVVRAQEDRDPPHPAHIHSGSCDDLGDIVYPLTDVALATAGEAFGAASAVPVEESDTTIDASLTDILAAPHAVNIHQSADAIQNYIACGDIGGRAHRRQASDWPARAPRLRTSGSGYSRWERCDHDDSDRLLVIPRDSVARRSKQRLQRSSQAPPRPLLSPRPSRPPRRLQQNQPLSRPRHPARKKFRSTLSSSPSARTRSRSRLATP